MQDLALLKAELKQTLALVEAQEGILEESMRPQTTAEIDELEHKLTDALEDLREQREKLGRQAEAETKD